MTEAQKNWVNKNRDKINEKRRQRRKIKIENRVGSLSSEAIKVYNLKNLYNLTIEQFDALLKKQNNQCAICGNALKRGSTILKERPHIDHNHRCCAGAKTCGKCIRGLLCNNCNRGIGYLQDSVDVLKKAISYLERGDY